VVFVLGQTGMGKSVPCIFALLPNKERNSYQRLASCIRDQLKSVQHVLVHMIHMDFEKGLMAAFNSTFPGNIISGCEFHWKSCLRKRISADGLLVYYNSNVKMQQLVRYIWALACIPRTEIVRAWETVILVELKDVLNDMEVDFSKELESFIKYVDSTWIGERNPRTMLRKKPAYSHDQWNKYEELIAGESRTNNTTEGYNNSFSTSLPAGATEWSLTDRFKIEESVQRRHSTRLLWAITDQMRRRAVTSTRWTETSS
jgi:hypothetical protein